MEPLTSLIGLAEKFQKKHSSNALTMHLPRYNCFKIGNSAASRLLTASEVLNTKSSVFFESRVLPPCRMNNITITGDGLKLTRFETIVLLFNGCFSLSLSLAICILNTVLILATAKFPLRPKKPIDKIHNAFFYSNLTASIMFLPYFGVTEILHGLETTSTTIHFPSYLSSTFSVFAQANVQMSLFTSIERCTAFVSPYLHRRLTSRRKALITLFVMESCLLLFVCLSLTGINEQVFYTIYLHMFFSFPMSLLILITGFTYWKIKTRNRITSNEIPQSVEMLQLHRKHSTRAARKYLTVVSIFLLPLILCILPWYIVKVSELTDQKAIVAKDVGFFWHRLSMTLVFLPDVLLPITLTIRFEAYYNSVRRYFRG